MKNLLCAGLGVIWTVLSANAQQFSAEDIARRTIERRAIEVVNWGMSAVNTDLMLQEMRTKTAGKVNQIVYWSRPLDWHNQTLTPNPDAIYLMAFFNTKDAGPICWSRQRALTAHSMATSSMASAAWMPVHPAPTPARAAKFCCCHPVTPMPSPTAISPAVTTCYAAALRI
jgi:hypothetical protein